MLALACPHDLDRAEVARGVDAPAISQGAWDASDRPSNSRAVAWRVAHHRDIGPAKAREPVGEPARGTVRRTRHQTPGAGASYPRPATTPKHESSLWA
eukprot:10570753-Alexandrium_andersonii.AAC.1